MKPDDVSLRCNLVTLSEDDKPYEEKTIEDYCADDISTEEANELIEAVQAKLGNETFHFYAGVSYRHCLIWHSGTTDLGSMTPPHDITGKVITEYLSDSENAKPLIEMMKKSYDILKDHPVNQKRKANGRRPANSIWLWGEGTRPAMGKFEEIYGIKGGVVSAVDLIKGIAAAQAWRLPMFPEQRDISTLTLRARQTPLLICLREMTLFTSTLRLPMNADTETSLKTR